MTRKNAGGRRYRRLATQGGYNLIEVLIAMALLGTILISVITLFVLGRKNVYSGKQMTIATSLATSVMEDLAQLNVEAIYRAFDMDGTVAPASYTLFGQNYTNALLRSTNASIVGSPPADISAENDPDGAGPAVGVLTRWTNLINGDARLKDGTITIVLRPTDPILDSGTGTIVTAQGRPRSTILKIRAIVSWNEGLRQRTVVLDTARVRRN